METSRPQQSSAVIIKQQLWELEPILCPGRSERRGTTGGIRNRKAVESNLGIILFHDDLNVHGFIAEYTHDLQN